MDHDVPVLSFDHPLSPLVIKFCAKRAENQKPVIFSRKGAKTQREENMTENEIAKIVVDAAYHIHRRLGPGLLESVYEVILAYALNRRRLKVERRAPVPIIFDGIFRVANRLYVFFAPLRLCVRPFLFRLIRVRS